MASTVSDSGGSADRFRRAQRGVSRGLIRDMRSLRRLIVPKRLKSTLPTWIDALRELLNDYGSASASLAADFYDAERSAAGVSDRFTVPIPEGIPDEQIDSTLRWATKDVWERAADDPRATVAQLQPLDVRLDVAEKKAEGAAERLMLNQGRETIREAVQQDPRAIAYARAAALGACSFCALMASRGAVYKNLDTVGREANERFVGNDSVIKYHNACRCQPIPVFAGQRFALSAHAREWDRLYQEHAAPFPGDQLRRFRRALAEHNKRTLPGAF